MICNLLKHSIWGIEYNVKQGLGNWIYLILQDEFILKKKVDYNICMYTYLHIFLHTY